MNNNNHNANTFYAYIDMALHFTILCALHFYDANTELKNTLKINLSFHSLLSAVKICLSHFWLCHC